MNRVDKGKAVSRYLTAATGIPLLRFDKETSRIIGPPPFRFYVTTDAAGWRFFQGIRELDDFVIRYDKYVGVVEDAYVGMKLSTFATLLTSQYNSLQDRVTTYIEGD